MKAKVFILIVSLLTICSNASALAVERPSIASLSLPMHARDRLEQIYLLEFTTTMLAAARNYALVAGRAPDFAIEPLRKFTKCQSLFAVLEERQEELFAISAANKIEGKAYFEHLLTLSLAFTYMNRKLHELGEERVEIEKNFMRSVSNSTEVDKRLAAIDERIALLNHKIDTVFTADPANMLLTIKVGKRKLPLYQEIVTDYYHLLSTGVVGPKLISMIQQLGQQRLDAAWDEVERRNRKFLHRAWRHTCARGAMSRLWPAHDFKPFGFYLKHRTLVAQVNTLLQQEDDKALLELQRRITTYFVDSLKPQKFRSSGLSFLGTLAALTLPAYIPAYLVTKKLNVPKKVSNYALPVVGTLGASNAAFRTKALHDIRQQLETGVLTGLNSYSLYDDFRRQTSLSMQAFSHAAVAGLAMVLLRMPKKSDELDKLVKSHRLLLVTMGVVGSVASLVVAETIQTGNINVLKDRDFLYNLLVVAAIDLTVFSFIMMNLPYETTVALTAAASVIFSVGAHLLSGKEMNWDRIIFDTAYISTFTLFKAKYFYTKGSLKLIDIFKKKGVDNIGTTLGIVGTMGLMNNVLGNFPYAWIARNWVERPVPHNKFPLPKEVARDDFSYYDLAQEIEQVLMTQAGDNTELKELIQQWLSVE